LLRKQGLSGKAREIFYALIISRFSYALPAFAGFLSRLHVTRFNAFFRKSFEWGIMDRIFDAETLISCVQFRLIKRFKDNTEHCLNQLLSELRHASYISRQCGDNFQLPVVSKVLFKKNYIVNCLCKFR
jgi:hypothetical protein